MAKSACLTSERSRVNTATTPVPSKDWRSFVQEHKTGLIIAGSVVGLFLLFVIFLVSMIGWYNGTRNGLIDRETTLNAQYQGNQAELDAFVKKVHEEFQIAGAKTAAIDKVLTDAVRGRYDGNLTPALPGQSNALISALREAYPDLGGLNIYDRLVTEISAGRESFKQVQVKLLDMLRDYESYRSKGVFRHMLVDSIGYPRLQARIGTQSFKGEDALNQMHLIVTSDATNQDFTSGTEDGIQFTPTSTP